MEKLRIFLADDHQIVREGLRILIDAEPDLEVVGEASDGASAWEMLQHCKPDVVVLDFTMPSLNGAQLCERVREQCRGTRVVALTFHEDRAYLRQLLESGAKGYVLKRAAARELIHAIRIVAAGGMYLDPEMAGKVVEGYLSKEPTSGPSNGPRLSDREEKVLRQIALGYGNREIAVQLELSVKTIETYKARLYEKLKISNRAELVRFAMKQGILIAIDLNCGLLTAFRVDVRASFDRFSLRRTSRPRSCKRRMRCVFR